MSVLTAGGTVSGIKASPIYAKPEASITYEKLEAEIQLDFNSINQKFLETIVLENGIPAFTITMNIADVINLSDVSGVIRILGLLPTDTITLTDNASTVDISADAYFRSFADGITVKEPITYIQNPDSQINGETINGFVLGWDTPDLSFEDGASITTGPGTASSETLTDIITITPGIGAASSITLSEVLAIGLGFNRTFGHGLSLGDTSPITVGYNDTDTMTMSDIPNAYIVSNITNGDFINGQTLN